VLDLKPPLLELVRWRMTLDRRIAKLGVNDYLQSGLSAYRRGERLGRENQTTFEGLHQLLEKEGIKLVRRETHPSSHLAIRAWLDTGSKEIILFLPMLNAIEKRLPWTVGQLESVAIAHEYFHYLQSEGHAPCMSEEYPLKKRWGIFSRRSQVFDEIAAAGFAQGILGLSYSPLEIDYYMASPKKKGR
jgi:hypothetical protein